MTYDPFPSDRILTILTTILVIVFCVVGIVTMMVSRWEIGIKRMDNEGSIE